jgi:hypothetical protein
VFRHDDHVKVHVWHEGEVGTVSLLRSPATTLAGISQDDIKITANSKTNVTVERNVTSVVWTTHKVYGEPTIRSNMRAHSRVLLIIEVIIFLPKSPEIESDFPGATINEDLVEL